MSIIHVSKRANDWHACLDGNQDLWEAGPTIEAAVRECLRTRAPALLGASVTLLLTLPESAPVLPGRDVLIPPHPTSPGRWTYSVGEVATRMGVPASTVRSWVRLGTLRTVRIGGRVLVPESEIARLGIEVAPTPTP